MSASIAAKRALKPGPKSSGLIKGEAFAGYIDGSAPGFSASGQDVWLPMALAHGRGRGVVLSAVGARCGKVFLADDPIWGTVANTVAWNIAEGWDQKFVHYLLNRESFWIKGGAAQPYVQVEASLSQTVQLIPLDEQRQIAEYLDRETGKIDELIAKQEQLIKVLAKRRTALITRATTRGLDASAEMAESGVEWLGEIPMGWRCGALRYGISFITSGSRGWAEHYADEGSVFIRIGNLTRASIGLDLSDVQFVDLPDHVEGTRAKTQRGDLLFSITAFLGSVAVIDESAVGAFVSQHVAIARPVSTLFIPEYLGYFALSEPGQRQLKEGAYGGTKLQLSLEDIRAFVVVRPPLDTQRAIVDLLGAQLSKMDELLRAAKAMIALLRERRAALISAAVTGKIDVRGL